MEETIASFDLILFAQFFFRTTTAMSEMKIYENVMKISCSILPLEYRCGACCSSLHGRAFFTAFVCLWFGGTSRPQPPSREGAWESNSQALLAGARPRTS